MRYEYETVTFGCSLKTRNGINDKLQDLLDEYSKKGWRLHTMQMTGISTDFCVCVFEREIQ